MSRSRSGFLSASYHDSFPRGGRAKGKGLGGGLYPSASFASIATVITSGGLKDEVHLRYRGNGHGQKLRRSQLWFGTDGAVAPFTAPASPASASASRRGLDMQGFFSAGELQDRLKLNIRDQGRERRYTTSREAGTSTGYGGHGIAARDGSYDDDDGDECLANWLELDRTYYTKGFTCCFRHSHSHSQG